MPKVPIISGMEVIRVMKRLGFVIVRQRGSHIILSKGHSGCVVPNHHELKIGTLLGVLKQAGVPLEEFIATLHN